jgi:molecular chaperone DnaK (HSP70)
LHPAKLEALERAAKNAGFNNVELMCEPEAAGHAFLKEVGSNSNKPILVVDWGGGTLDISILSIGANNKIKCLKSFFKGSDTMGGERIDRLLLDYAKKRYAEENRAKVDNTLTALPGQLRKIERFKRQLDRLASATLILSEGLAGIRISRSDLATVIEPFMSDVKQLIYNVLKIAKKKGCTPDRMLLIGGTNRMPYIQDELNKEFGMQTIVWQNSRVAVSLGAAYAADGGAHPAKVKSTSPVENQRHKKQSAKVW